VLPSFDLLVKSNILTPSPSSIIRRTGGNSCSLLLSAGLCMRIGRSAAFPDYSFFPFFENLLFDLAKVSLGISAFIQSVFLYYVSFLIMVFSIMRLSPPLCVKVGQPCDDPPFM